MQTKRRSLSHLRAVLPDCGLLSPQGGPRVVAEDGTGVLISIVDSGFDLSHPMFRDASGRLLVDARLDQPNGKCEYTRAQLEREWANSLRGRGADGT